MLWKGHIPTLKDEENSKIPHSGCASSSETSFRVTLFQSGSCEDHAGIDIGNGIPLQKANSHKAIHIGHPERNYYQPHTEFSAKASFPLIGNVNTCAVLLQSPPIPVVGVNVVLLTIIFECQLQVFIIAVKFQRPSAWSS